MCNGFAYGTALANHEVMNTQWGGEKTKGENISVAYIVYIYIYRQVSTPHSFEHPFILGGS